MPVTYNHPLFWRLDLAGEQASFVVTSAKCILAQKSQNALLVLGDVRALDLCLMFSGTKTWWVPV